MNKKLYSILFFVPLIVCLLAMTVVTGCSDDDEPLQSTYGYVQFRLLKSASMDKGTTTRAVTDKLDKLNDAQKVKVVMQYNGSTITQTLLLNAYNAENAEFGLRSDKLKLLTGTYTVIGYYLYDKLDNVLYAGPAGENNAFAIVSDGLHTQNLSVDAVARGMVTFKLVKDFVKTRATGEEAYPLSNILAIDITVKNLFTQELTTIKSIRVKYVEDFTDKPAEDYVDADRNQETSYMECDTVAWLKAGTYQISSYTTYSDKKAKNVLEVATVQTSKSFVVKDNEVTKDAEVPVRLDETAEYIKDYIALKAIWTKMDGQNWKYYGESSPMGANWNFNKDIDLWGNQPGVQLLDNGRVALLSLAGFGAKGVVPDEIGQLTELRILSLGTHDEKLGGHLFDNYSINMSEEQRKAMRMDYDTKFLSKDAREDLSGILRKGINDNPEMKPIKSSRISTKDVQFGVLTNGITGVSKAIMRLTKLEQFFIANSPIRSDGFFVEVKPDSPYYEEQDEWKWEDMTTLTDIEIYNCPNLETLPVDMLKNLPELVSLNVARNPGIYAEDRDVLKENWEEIIGDDSKCADKIQLLYLGYNKLKEFPEYDLLKKMKKLSLLDCTNNEIETLHPFGKEVKLMKVYLDNNKITKIPSVEEDNGLKYFFGWNDVENFSCSNNLLTEVPNIFNAKSDFVMGTVDFSNNLIDKFEDGEDHRGINASTVNLHHNKFKVFPKLLFEKESPMQTLNLSANGMTTIPKGALKGKTSLEYLTSLDLTYNKLSSLTDDFYVINMPVLYGLDLSYNQFSKFPTQPLSINYLVVFGIRHQRDDNGNRTLREWPTGLYKNPSLKAFYIGSNDLRKIDDTISPTILMFEIKDNPNISIDISDVCPYIKAGRYTLVYDKSQDIRGCDALDLDK
ncbi:DUF4458 domain-containing protein [Bacteroides finegoldii]|uniref:DUF4458 domain-containing protein n=1 Tax=Bacteroides finegoldii TaxID=338188 RepID=UPI003183B691